MSPPDATPIIDLIEAFRRSKVMFTAVELGIPDYLSGSAASAAQIAEAKGLNPDATERLLDACVALGLLTKSEGSYANAPVADSYLKRDSDRTLAGYVLYSDRVLYKMWGNLEDAVREGTHRWAETFNSQGPLFDHFFKTEDSMRTFILGMHGFGCISSPYVVEAFDLSEFKHMVDLGGASGHLVIAACERYSSLQGTVFDLPMVTRVAEEHIAKSTAKERLSVAPGDFFTDSFPPADLYAVGRILHDWSEEKIARLLSKVFDSLPSGGALLIAEKLLDDDRTGPLSGNLQSLNMLVCTEGKERSVRDYRDLLTRAGFHRVEGRRTRTPLDALLARKP